MGLEILLQFVFICVRPAVFDVSDECRFNRFNESVTEDGCEKHDIFLFIFAIYSTEIFIRIAASRHRNILNCYYETFII